MDDFYDDDFFEDEFDEDFDDGFEMVEDNIVQDVENEESLESGISFEDFLFWGGFVGINIDEEREGRRLAKKLERETSEPDDIFRVDDD